MLLTHGAHVRIQFFLPKAQTRFFSKMLNICSVASPGHLSVGVRLNTFMNNSLEACSFPSTLSLCALPVFNPALGIKFHCVGCRHTSQVTFQPPDCLMFMELQTPVDVSQCFLLFLSSGDSCGGPDPDRDVLRRAELVHGQHPAADLKPRCEGSDGGTVQRVAEYPAEPKHPRTLEPHRPLNQGPWTRHRHCTLPQTVGNPDWREGAAVQKLNIWDKRVEVCRCIPCSVVMPTPFWEVSMFKFQ